LHSVTKETKTEYLSKTVKRVKLATHEVKERINFNSPLHNIDIHKNNRNKNTNSKSKEKIPKMIPYGIIIIIQMPAKIVVLMFQIN